MKLDIKKFDLSLINKDDLILIIGKKNTGKSFLIKHILSYFSKTSNNYKPFGLIFSPDSKNIYNNIIPLILREYELDEKIIIKIFNKYNLYKERIGLGINENTSSFLVFDDCIFFNNKLYNEYLLKLILLKKLLNILIIISIQDILFLLNKDIKNKIHYLFISTNKLKFNNNNQEVENIYKIYANFIPSFDIFKQICLFSTSNEFEFLVINNDINKNWENRVYWFKANKVEEYKLCIDYYWKNDLFLINNYNQKDEELNKISIKQNYRNYFNEKRNIILKLLKNYLNYESNESYELNEKTKNNLLKYKIYENKKKKEIKDKNKLDKLINDIYLSAQK